jgi:hypothetical protein
MADKPTGRGWWVRVWPLLPALGLFLLLLGIALAGQLNAGGLILPEEDAYQRLALARNLASRFAWEIIPGQFASAFGTLLWPLLLAPLFRILGSAALWPWIANALLSVGLIVLLGRTVRRAVASPPAQAALLALLVLVLPLAPLSASGMEQVLFLVLLIVFLDFWARRMEAGAGGLPALTAAAVLLAATRYEGMLLVALAAGLLLLKKDFAAGIVVPLAAAVPLGLFGLLSMRAGWLPVPASVYLRRAELIPADLSQLPDVIFRSLAVLGVNPELRAVAFLTALLPAWLGLTGRLDSMRARDFFAPALALAAMLADLTLVGDRGYRYDAWLVLLGAWAVLPALGRILADAGEVRRVQTVTLLAGSALAVLFGFPLLNHGVQASVAFGQSVAEMRTAVRPAADWAAGCSAGPILTDIPGTVFFYSGRADIADVSGLVGLTAFQKRRGGAVDADWLRAEAARTGAVAALLFDPAARAQAATIWDSIGGWTAAGCAACPSVRIFRMAEDAGLQTCTAEFLTRLPADETVLPSETAGSR